MDLSNKLAVIIVDYGTLTETMGFIKRFHDCFSGDAQVEFVIVDNWDKVDANLRRDSIGFRKQGKNYSIDKDRIIQIWYKQHEDSRIYLVTTGNNGGYAKGNNIGAIFSLNALKVKYAIFSNNDILFSTRFTFKQLKNVFDMHEDCFIWGPLVKGMDGRLQGPVLKEDSAFRALIWQYSFSHLLTCRTTNSCNIEEMQKVHHVVGCFMVVDLEKFTAVGMFDEHTFLYYEEDILSERGRNCHCYFYYNPSVEVIHKGNSTIGRVMRGKAKILLFNSACYYYKRYKKVSDLVISIAKVNFYVFYMPIYWLLHQIKKPKI